MNDGKIIGNWSEADRQLFGWQPVLLSHRLAETGLFTEEALADLLGEIPASHYNLNAMGHDHDNPEWREGHINGHSGRVVIDAIRRGRMWLNIRDLQQVDRRYRDVVDQMMDEIEGQVENFHTFKRSIGVLISSPKARVFYHADVPGQSLWQVSGRKRLHVYPNIPPFIRPEDMEKIVLGMTEEEIPFKPWFDDHARVFDLGPGQMVNWPLNGPHQVINEDCLNISVTTSHWTTEIRNAYAVNYANGVLRNTFGITPGSSHANGLSVYPKAALAYFWRKLNLQRGKQVLRQIKFKIDPSAPSGMSTTGAMPSK